MQEVRLHTICSLADSALEQLATESMYLRRDVQGQIQIGIQLDFVSDEVTEWPDFK
mgnify:CR=1 FL=1